MRETANIKEGDSLLWEIYDDGRLIVRPQSSKTEYLASLNKRTYGTYEKAIQHVAEEKAKWE